MIYLDISKAFDTVPHQRLINKMRWYGLEGNVLGWLSDFLLDRVMRVNLKGEKSSWCDVTSSVPQGSVGGPTQFCIYINDMSENIKNKIIQFADDTKMWRIIANEEDRDALQMDLDTLAECSNKWLLKFNPLKCKVLHLGSGNQNYEYTMKDQNGIRIVLGESTLEKDLGVLISKDLKVADQCNKAAKKAMRVLGMVKRSFKNLDKESLKTIYCSYIRSHLEYCIHAWSPYYRKDIQTLEKVQQRATKLVRRLKNLPYEERLRKLKLYPLEQRRLRGDLIETFKILSGKERIDPAIFFRAASSKNLRGNSKKLYKQRSRLLLRQNFFSQRVVNYWNSLPNAVVEANSIQFKYLHFKKKSEFSI